MTYITTYFVLLFLSSIPLLKTEASPFSTLVLFFGRMTDAYSELKVMPSRLYFRLQLSSLSLKIKKTNTLIQIMLQKKNLHCGQFILPILVIHKKHYQQLFYFLFEIWYVINVVFFLTRNFNTVTNKRKKLTYLLF